MDCTEKGGDDEREQCVSDDTDRLEKSSVWSSVLSTFIADRVKHLHFSS